MLELANPGLSDFGFHFMKTVVGVVDETFSQDAKAYLKADRSLVLNIDLAIERSIILDMSPRNPSAKMYFEEGQVNVQPKFSHHALSPHEYENIMSLDEVWFGDPIDCTLYLRRGLPGWSSQWSRMKKGVFDFGIFYAPTIMDKFLCVAERGRGMWLANLASGKGWQESMVHSRILGEMPVVGHTMSISDEPLYHPFFKALKKHSIPVPVVPAGLGLALAACGNLDVSIVEPHNPWDLMHVVCMAKEAQKKLVYWKLYDGKTEIFTELDASLFRPDGLKVGCIVGVPELVELCIEKMEEHMGALVTFGESSVGFS